MSGNITQKMLGGARRKNGHKTTCNCHICENMRLKAKRGGYQEEYNKKVSGGSKKKNGHKADCKCPICKNMSKKMKKGGIPPRKVDLDDLYDTDEPPLVANEPPPAANEPPPVTNEPAANNVIPYNIYNGLTPENINNDFKEGEKGGSRRRRRSRRRKGGNGDPDIENQKGDIEEEGVRSTMDQPHEVEEEGIVVQGDNYDEIDELDRAELGESGPNKVGGTRRRRKSQRRKTRRNKKHSCRHRKK